MFWRYDAEVWNVVSSLTFYSQIKEQIMTRNVALKCAPLLAFMGRILWKMQIVFSFQPADGAIINPLLPNQAIFKKV